MESWVAAHLTGGIGNRLFEHAAALGAAEKWKIPCVFLKSSIEKNDHGPADNILKLFPEIPQIESGENIMNILEPRGDCFRYIPFPEEKPADCIRIDGWRQTSKYFPKNLDSLRPHWETLLSKEIQQQLLKKYDLLEEAQRKTTWFFHIRLGDYKILPHHQISVIPYYEKCLQKIPKEHTILLFSDEPNLCATWFQQQCSSRNLTNNIVHEDEISSLWLMSQCWGGAVVANSTFSWWGAFFGRMSMSSTENYKAFFPSVWGSGLPPAVDINPPWGTVIHI